jgi:MSHA pilin protein MshC
VTLSPAFFFMRRYPMFRARRRCPIEQGFTTVELIVVIVVAGILAAFAVARFIGKEGFESRGFHDRATSVVRHAQKTAIAQRRNVFVVVTADRIAACYAADCAAPVRMSREFGFSASMGSALAKCGGDSTWLCAGTPDGVSVPVTDIVTFSFNGLGRPSIASTTTINVPGIPPRQIVVEAETGYVHN